MRLQENSKGEKYYTKTLSFEAIRFIRSSLHRKDWVTISRLFRGMAVKFRMFKQSGNYHLPDAHTYYKQIEKIIYQEGFVRWGKYRIDDQVAVVFVNPNCKYPLLPEPFVSKKDNFGCTIKKPSGRPPKDGVYRATAQRNFINCMRAVMGQHQESDDEDI